MEELVLDKYVLTFDGRVVEVFHEGTAATTRFHVRFLSVHANGPDRKGRFDITLAPGPEPYNGVKLTVDGARMPEVQAFVENVKRSR